MLICGYRSGDQFRAYKYSDSVYKHTCMLITELRKDGTIQALAERVRTEEVNELEANTWQLTKTYSNIQAQRHRPRATRCCHQVQRSFACPARRN